MDIQKLLKDALEDAPSGKEGVIAQGSDGRLFFYRTRKQIYSPFPTPSYTEPC